MLIQVIILKNSFSASLKHNANQQPIFQGVFLSPAWYTLRILTQHDKGIPFQML
jgi:hypothetical protein